MFKETKGKSFLKRILGWVLAVSLTVSGIPVALAAPAPEVESVTVEDLEIIRNTMGYWEQEYNPETDAYDLEYYKYDYRYDLCFSVRLTDGTVLRSEDGAVEYGGEYYYLDDVNDGQSYEDPWDLGAHEVTAELFGHTARFTVTVVESPVLGIRVENLEIIYRTNGAMTSEYNPETDAYDLEWFRYMYGERLQYTVEFRDGSTARSEGGGIYYNGEFYSLSCEDDQTFSTPWGIGAHAVRGELMGFKTEFNVTVVESPILSVDVRPVHIIERTEGSLVKDFDPGTFEYGEEYYKYSYSPDVTLMMKDGSQISAEDGYFDYGGEEYRIDISDDQSYSSQWGVGTHRATMSVMGLQTEFDVVIEPTPIVSLEASGVELMENTSGYTDSEYNPATDEYDLEYFRYVFTPEIRVTLRDGTVVTSSDGSITYNGKAYILSISDDQAYKSPWGVGRHTAVCELMGVRTEFEVAITETAIQSMEVADIELIENTGGYTDYDYNPVTGTYDLEYFRYDVSDKLKVTVTLQDGTVIEGVSGGLQIGGAWYALELSDGQSYEHSWDVGVHTVSCRLMGHTAYFHVTIVETPVESVEFTGLRIYENTRGHIEQAFNPVTGRFDREYFRYDPDPEFKITLKNGEILEGKGSVEYNGEEYYLQMSDGQSYEHPWGVGAHTVPCEILGFRTGFDVEILETPVESVEVSDIQLIENVDGYMDWDVTADEDEVAYFRYILEPTFKVTLKDGTVLEGQFGLEFEGEFYLAQIFDDQSGNTPWGIGVHTAECEILGVRASFRVFVIEQPIKSMEISDVRIVEKTHGEWDTDYNVETEKFDLPYFKYRLEPVIKVTLKDGTVLECKGAMEYNGFRHAVTVHDDQSGSAPWGTGVHTAECALMGFSAGFRVVIVEKPVFGEKVYHNLRMQDLIKIGYAFSITGDFEECGVLLWTGERDGEVTVDAEGVRNEPLVFDGGFYTAESDGVYAQHLDVTHYARPYVKVGDQYIYGDVDAYSPLAYAQAALEGSDEGLKQLMTDLLNYGAYAQLYFAESTGAPAPEKLINELLPEDRRTLNWTDELLAEAPAIDKDTDRALDMTWFGTNLNLLEAIQMNMAATGDIAGMYYWTEADYAAAQTLDAASATGEAVIRRDGAYTIGGLAGITARSVNEVYYVCCYDEAGNLGAVRADSVASYATRLIRSGASTEATVHLAKALLIYGSSAEAYFGNNG